MPSFQRDLLRCHCHGHCPDYENEGNCTVESGGYCFTLVEQVYNKQSKKYEVERTYGCLSPEETGLFQCKGTRVGHFSPKNITCCKDQDFCNRYMVPTYQSVPELTSHPPKLPVIPSVGIELWFLFACVSCFLSIVLIFALYKYRRQTLHPHLKEILKHGNEEGKLQLNPFISCKYTSVSSLSSAESPTTGRWFVESRQLIELLGQSAFGPIWKAKSPDSAKELRAIRFYTSSKYWNTEREVYTNCRYQSIGPLLCAQKLPNSTYCLSIRYYPQGSLADFLHEHVLDDFTMISLLHSASCGLLYLHASFLGNPGKPGIAHLNLKSSNIMVDDNGKNCIISDFAMSMIDTKDRAKNDSNHCHDYLPQKLEKEPTSLRYFAPEILTSPTYRPVNFEAAKKSDIYSFALIMWETASRCLISANPDEFPWTYQQPFQAEFPMKEPDRDDLIELVCRQERRPQIPQLWQKSHVLSQVQNLIIESWHSNPNVRLSILRIKKDLNTLLSLLRLPGFEGLKSHLMDTALSSSPD